MVSLLCEVLNLDDNPQAPLRPQRPNWSSSSVSRHRHCLYVRLITVDSCPWSMAYVSSSKRRYSLWSSKDGIHVGQVHSESSCFTRSHVNCHHLHRTNNHLRSESFTRIYLCRWWLIITWACFQSLQLSKTRGLRWPSLSVVPRVLKFISTILSYVARHFMFEGSWDWDRVRSFVAMAMILSSKLETGASSLLQSSVLRPCEPTCSCLAVVPFRGSKSLGVLRNEGHSKFANERSRGFFVSTRATVTTYIDVDSVRIDPVDFSLWNNVWKWVSNMVSFRYLSLGSILNIWRVILQIFFFV